MEVESPTPSPSRPDIELVVGIWWESENDSKCVGDDCPSMTTTWPYTNSSTPIGTYPTYHGGMGSRSGETTRLRNESENPQYIKDFIINISWRVFAAVSGITNAAYSNLTDWPVIPEEYSVYSKIPGQNPISPFQTVGIYDTYADPIINNYPLVDKIFIGDGYILASRWQTLDALANLENLLNNRARFVTPTSSNYKLYAVYNNV